MRTETLNAKEKFYLHAHELGLNRGKYTKYIADVKSSSVRIVLLTVTLTIQLTVQQFEYFFPRNTCNIPPLPASPSNFHHSSVTFKLVVSLEK